MSSSPISNDSSGNGSELSWRSCRSNSPESPTTSADSSICADEKALIERLVEVNILIFLINLIDFLINFSDLFQLINSTTFKALDSAAVPQNFLDMFNETIPSDWLKIAKKYPRDISVEE